MNAAANVQSVTVKSPVIRNSCRTEENKTHMQEPQTHTHTLPSKKKEPVSVCPCAASCVVRCSNGNPRPLVWVAAAAEEQRQQREDSVVAFYKRVGEGSLKINISSGSAFASSPSAKRKPLKSIIHLTGVSCLEVSPVKQKLYLLHFLLAWIIRTGIVAVEIIILLVDVSVTHYQIHRKKQIFQKTFNS